MYTKEEKQNAKAIVQNEVFVDLLKKVFLETEEKIAPEFVDNRTNEQLGEIVRADSLAERKIANRLNKLQMLGQEAMEGKSHTVKK